MKLQILSTLLLLAAPVAAQTTPAAGEPGTLERVSLSADQELARSIEQLNALRDSIAAEKLPLAQEMTALEDMLVQLRREQDQLLREADSTTLQVTRIQTDTKLRQEELVYVGNLLDEYARTVESKLGTGEVQFCGEALAAARQASENTALSPAEKFALQTGFVELTVKRIADAIGGMRFPGIGVDLQGAVASGTFALIGPVALFRGGNAAATGLVVPQTGSDKPLIRPLEGALQSGILALVDAGEGLLPLDPSRGGALQALVQKTNLVHIFEKGGPIMWPLLVASILAFGTVIERLFFLLREKWKRDPVGLDQFFGAIARGEREAAAEIAAGSKFFVLRALGYALTHHEQSLPNALLYSQAQEMKRFRRGIPMLDTVITLAPLLGLLGTVTGMMGSFSLIGGDLGAPGAITGGIAEALIATAFGLGIAITALIPFNYLNARMDEASHDLESAATQLELLVRRDDIPRPTDGSGSNGGNGLPARPAQPGRPRELIVTP